MLVLVMVGTPLAWHNFRGGVTQEWFGFWLDVGRFELGISAFRAAWAVEWLERKARKR